MTAPGRVPGLSFDCACFVIHCPRLAPRLDRFKAAASKAGLSGYEVVEGMDAKDWERDGWTELARQVAEGELASWAELTPSEVAISRSHALAWSRLVSPTSPFTSTSSSSRNEPPLPSPAPPKYGLVLEDDVEVGPDFIQALNEIYAVALTAVPPSEDARGQDGDEIPAFDVLLLHNEDVLQQRHKRLRLPSSIPVAGGVHGGTDQETNAGVECIDDVSWSSRAPPPRTRGVLNRLGLEVAGEPMPYCAAAAAYVVSRQWAAQLLARRYPVRLPVDFYMGEVAAIVDGLRGVLSSGEGKLGEASNRSMRGGGCRTEDDMSTSNVQRWGGRHLTVQRKVGRQRAAENDVGEGRQNTYDGSGAGRGEGLLMVPEGWGKDSANNPEGQIRVPGALAAAARTATAWTGAEAGGGGTDPYHTSDRSGSIPRRCGGGWGLPESVDPVDDTAHLNAAAAFVRRLFSPSTTPLPPVGSGLSSAPCPAFSEGVVICAGGREYLPLAYAAVRSLRRAGCRLPVELWHGVGEMTPDAAAGIEDDSSLAPVTCRSLAGLAGSPDVNLSSHSSSSASILPVSPAPGAGPHGKTPGDAERQSPRWTEAETPQARRRPPGFAIKPLAVMGSAFSRVILLDADVVVLRDPAPLLASVRESDEEEESMAEIEKEGVVLGKRGRFGGQQRYLVHGGVGGQSGYLGKNGEGESSTSPRRSDARRRKPTAVFWPDLCRIGNGPLCDIAGMSTLLAAAREGAREREGKLEKQDGSPGDETSSSSPVAAAAIEWDGVWEQDSGVVVVDRSRCAAALMMCVALNTGASPGNLAGHLYGDKDTWQLSWKATRTSYATCPFHPALLGPAEDVVTKVGGSAPKGTALLHYGLDGSPLLIHPCMRKLWTPLKTTDIDIQGGSRVKDGDKGSIDSLAPHNGQGIAAMSSAEEKRQEWAVVQRDKGLSGHGVRVEFDDEFTHARMVASGKGSGVTTNLTSADIRAAEDLCRRDIEEATKQPWFDRLPLLSDM